MLVDQKLPFCYNNDMIRKKRSDRTHVVYMLEHGSDFYIGVTAKTESTPMKSVRTRWNKHCYRARTENHTWLLYQRLREHDHGWFYSVLAVVRGKAQAHAYERDLIRQMRPGLNTDCRGVA